MPIPRGSRAAQLRSRHFALSRIQEDAWELGVSADKPRSWMKDMRALAIGSLGEALVRAELESLGWPMLRNVILADTASSVEIDQIACAPAAIIVLETKTYSGEVSGEPGSEIWRLGLRDGRCFDVPNAHRQNAAHITAVRRVIHDNSIPVRGYVVNAGAGQFAPALAGTVVALRDLRARLMEDSASRRGADTALQAAWLRLVTSAARGEDHRTTHVARISWRF